MKIWITRQNASSVMAGGLKRLQIWFSKPVWVEKKIHEYRTNPFGGSVLEGFYEEGRWQVSSRGSIERESSCFGCIFGCNDSKEESLNEIALFVWQQLYKHFKQEEDMGKWSDLEESGEVKQQDFFLELELDIRLVKPVT